MERGREKNKEEEKEKEEKTEKKERRGKILLRVTQSLTQTRMS